MLNVEIKRIFGRPFFLVPETFFGKNVTITHKRHKIRLLQVKVNNTGAPPSFKLTENGRKRTEIRRLQKNFARKSSEKFTFFGYVIYPEQSELPFSRSERKTLRFFRSGNQKISEQTVFPLYKIWLL